MIQNPNLKCKLIRSACIFAVVLLFLIIAQCAEIKKSSNTTLPPPAPTRPDSGPEPPSSLSSLSEFISPEDDLLPLFEAFATEHQYKLLVEAKKTAQIEYLIGKYKRDAAKIKHYVELAYLHAKQHDMLEPELLLAVMQKESSLRPRVRSHYGALGLMQVVPRFHGEKLKKGESLFTPEVNIRVGSQILSEYWWRNNGDWAATLKKYSGNARNYAKDVLVEAERLSALGEKAAQNRLEALTAGRLLAVNSQSTH